MFNNIYYINQGDAATEFAGIIEAMKVKTVKDKEGNEVAFNPADFEIRIGGTKNAKGEYQILVYDIAAVSTGYKITGYVADAYATVTIGETTVEVADDGSFSFEKMANGIYDLMIKAPGAFNRTVSANVNGADLAVSTADNQLSLVYGAVTPDAEEITISDLTSLKIAFNSSVGDEGYSISCDLNRDGVINISDLTTIKLNFGMKIADAYTE